MKITFLGAAQTVTGSCFLVEAGDTKFLVDCGMFQGSRDLEDRNWEAFAFDPASIDYVFLTHAHLDHCGRLPALARHGFKGKIICTDATRDLAEIIMYDALSIQEHDYERGDLKYVDGSLKKPLFRDVDVEGVMSLFDVQEYSKSVKLNKNVEFRMRNAGHIMGSSIFEFWLRNGGHEQKVVFSGDLGQPGKRIVWDPDNVSEGDYVILESTYGDRLHKDKNESILEFLSVVKQAELRRGNVLIPVFAIERTQEILYELNLMVENGLLTNVPVYLDSPLAKKATTIFKKYHKYFDTDATRLMDKGDDPFVFQGLKMIHKPEESKTLAGIQGAIIMAGSGMCTGGRILHHLLNNIEDPASHVVFVGYQVRGTLGRKLVDGAKEIKIFGQTRMVRAKIHTIGGMSAHADQRDLRYWLRGFGASVKKVFLVHGELEVERKFAENIGEELSFPVQIVEDGETVELL